MKEKKGFTLIELLVVVSIIALLVSILLPALSRAREAAKRTVCSSNLHQFGLTIHYYAMDYNDFAPTGYPCQGGSTWLGALMPYLHKTFTGMDHSKKSIYLCPSNPALYSKYYNYLWNDGPTGGYKHVKLEVYTRKDIFMISDTNGYSYILIDTTTGAPTFGRLGSGFKRTLVGV